jgi:hypothetical protein
MRLFALLIATVLLATASAAVRPDGGSGATRCLDSGDRVTKLMLIRKLRRSPGILILGSSRAREADPSFLQKLTGHTGFNATVMGGTAADAWVMTRFIADRFPARQRRYLFFVDSAIATNGVPPDLADDPRARPYLGDAARPGRSDCPVRRKRYRPDGSIAHRYRRSRAQRARILRRSVGELVAQIRAHPPQREPDHPARYVYFERAIEFMNRQGARPVIVLNPIHPRVLAELERYGFPKRKAALRYLAQLRKRLDFAVVDAEDTRRWGGSAAHFENATHIDAVNMRRLLRYVVARSGGALTRDG